MLLLLGLGEVILFVSSMSILQEVPTETDISRMGPQISSSSGGQEEPMLRSLGASKTKQNDNEPFIFAPNSGDSSSTTSRNQYIGNLEGKTCEGNKTLFQSECHQILQQGPCNKGQWLVEINEVGACKDTICQSGYPEIPYNGRCFNDITSRNTHFQNCPERMTIVVSRDGTVECDCLPEHIFDAKSGTCYPAYRKQPCRYAQYFVLQSGQPKCVPNPCRLDDHVCKDGSHTCQKSNCVKLNSDCVNGTESGKYLVDPTTQKITCIPLSQLDKQGRTIANVPSFACAPGSKRDVNGVCRKTSSFTFS